MMVGALLPGCPIYANDEGCVLDSECDVGYVCDGVIGLCRPESELGCATPSECGANATCSRKGLCVIGDCSWPDIGCLAGYVCSKESGAFHCVASGSGGSAGASGAGSIDEPGTGGGGDDVPTTGGAGNDAPTSGGAAG
jgi:hypothetical protein